MLQVNYIYIVGLAFIYMELTKAKNIAKQLIEQHCNDYHFEWFNGTSTYGLCCRRIHTIKISKILTELNSEKEFRNTILHEIAHALTTGGHNKEFYKMCIKVGSAPERCYSTSVITPKKDSYIYECPKCKQKVTRHKMIGKNKTACGRCCNKYNFGNYSTEFILKFVERISVDKLN